jgi:hypothetical protein
VWHWGLVVCGCGGRNGLVRVFLDVGPAAQAAFAMPPGRSCNFKSPNSRKVFA